jgi:hypothetical protein
VSTNPELVNSSADVIASNSLDQNVEAYASLMPGLSEEVSAGEDYYDNTIGPETDYASLSGRQTFSGGLTGWNYNPDTNMSTCTFTDKAWDYSFSISFPGDYCPDSYVGY